MVALKVPDRLSILTYVSQYYNYFHGRSPIGGMAGIKRPSSEPSEEPVGKKAVSQPIKPSTTKPVPSQPSKHAPALVTAEVPTPAPRTVVPMPNKTPIQQNKVLADVANKTGSLSSNCAICRNHVHLVQRHLVDGKLYHRNCFRCKQCSNILLSGTYKAGPEPGTFICTSHHSNTQNKPARVSTTTRTTAVSNKPALDTGTTGLWNKTVFTTTVNSMGASSLGTEVNKPETGTVTMSSKTTGSSGTSVIRNSSPVTPGGNKFKPSEASTPKKVWTPTAEKTQTARELFFQSGSQTPGDSEREKARSFLQNNIPAEGSNRSPGPSSSIYSGVKSPGFQFTSRIGSNVSRSDTPSQKVDGKTGQSAALEQPRLRPVSAIEPSFQSQFSPSRSGTGRPSEEKKPVTRSLSIDHRTVSASPEEKSSESPADWRSRLKPVEKGPFTNRFTDAKEKHPSTINTELKKADTSSRLITTSSNQKPANIPAVTISSNLSGRDVTFSVLTYEDSSTSKPKTVSTPPVSGKGLSPTSTSIQTSSGASTPGSKPQKKRLHVNLDISNGWLNSDSPKSAGQKKPEGSESFSERNDESRKTSWIHSPQSSEQGKVSEDKNSSVAEEKSPTKSQADDVPDKKEIREELREIETQMNDLEHQGVNLEQQLRNCEGEEGEEKLMGSWLELIRKKQLLMRRESELVYLLKQQALEGEQVNVEEEYRRLASIPEKLKTDQDRVREEELLGKYLAIVAGRNAIIDGLDEDRLREEEEDLELQVAMQNLGYHQEPEEVNKRKPLFGIRWSKKWKQKSKKQTP
uniref:MICAL like 2 n=2 Tax=Latimeria chalumnae TaxID=7897 RepID=M3XKJ2_LATCH